MGLAVLVSFIMFLVMLPTIVQQKLGARFALLDILDVIINGSEPFLPALLVVSKIVFVVRLRSKQIFVSDSRRMTTAARLDVIMFDKTGTLTVDQVILLSLWVSVCLSVCLYICMSVCLSVMHTGSSLAATGRSATDVLAATDSPAAAHMRFHSASCATPTMSACTSSTCSCIAFQLCVIMTHWLYYLASVSPRPIGFTTHKGCINLDFIRFLSIGQVSTEVKCRDGRREQPYAYTHRLCTC